MKLTFLGTAASEGYPNAFCACERCEQARFSGGPNLRKRSSVLLNDDLLIDLGPDLMAAAQQHGLSLAKIQICLQTHEHEDHLDASNLIWRSAYCGVDNAPHLQMYATPGAFARMGKNLSGSVAERGLLDPDVSAHLNLTAHSVETFQTFAPGAYRVTSVSAAHAPELTALLYVIEYGGRTFNAQSEALSLIFKQIRGYQ